MAQEKDEDDAEDGEKRVQDVAAATVEPAGRVCSSRRGSATQACSAEACHLPLQQEDGVVDVVEEEEKEEEE